MKRISIYCVYYALKDEQQNTGGVAIAMASSKKEARAIVKSNLRIDREPSLVEKIGAVTRGVAKKRHFAIPRCHTLLLKSCSYEQLR